MKRLPVILWALTCAALLTPSLLPQATRLSRGALIGLGVLAAGTLWWKGRRKLLRFLVPGMLAAAAVFLFWPGQIRATPQQMRADYVARLRSYEGCPYFWGGEYRRGIDCSGLIRRGMIDVLVLSGLKQMDPAMVRRGLGMWWNDTSALALGQEHAGLTRLQFAADSINSIAADRLVPGDIAVTADGVHTLAYLGNGAWIQADPYPGKVHVQRVPADSGWFRVRVKILRWALLES